MKRFYLFITLTALLISSITTGSLYAVPASPHPITYTLPDGSTLTLRLVGDEREHWHFSSDGHLLLPHEDGFFYYAQCTPQGELYASSVRSHEIGLRSDAEQTFIATLDAKRITAARHTPKNDLPARIAPRRTPRRTPYPTTGQQPGLVILVSFEDKTFASDDPKTAFHNLLNQENYAENKATGSARDYFISASNGQYRPDFNVFGPVCLEKSYAYYGSNDAQGNDLHAEDMIIEACKALDSTIDFSQYDLDDDQIIDNVYVFYAGKGEADGGESTTIWPHSWEITAAYPDTAFYFDGKQLNHYACSNEIAYNRLVGIGTFCHEFSHVLGLPDLYDTQYGGSFDTGSWDIMSYGSYNNSSRTPPTFSAYERMTLGWLTPTELTETASVRLEPISTNSAFIIKTHRENEYFLLENRQTTGWDQYLYNHGMLIWHIDYDEKKWFENTVNSTPDHQHIDIEEADNLKTENTRRSDIFPGSYAITSFTDNTLPGMTAWDGTPLQKPITDIVELNGIIYFDFMGGTLSMPTATALEAQEITRESFSARWEKVDCATHYYLTVYTQSTDPETGAVSKKFLSSFRNRQVGDTTACLVYGLSPDTPYYYYVQAADSLHKGAISNTISLRTLTEETAIETPLRDTTPQWSLRQEGDQIILHSPALEGEKISVHDLSGQIRNEGIIRQGTFRIKKPVGGIYLIRIGRHHFKFCP